MGAAKTVASVSFLDNRSLSMDIEDVIGITVGSPIEVEPGQWFCDLIVHSSNGKVALQMLAVSPEHFVIDIGTSQGAEEQ